MGLFKKPNRKFRQREVKTDSEDENETVEPPENKLKLIKSDVKEKPSSSTETDNISLPNVASTSKDEKSESTLPKPSKLLSFHDEEDEGEVFKLKKSNYSRRLAKQREKERKKKESQNALIGKAQEESKDKPLTTEVSCDKSQVSQDSWDILAGNDAEDMDVESDEDKEKINPFKNVLQSGVIPDAATIYAMKKHRQMAREMGDFIPVEETEKDDESKSRLIRDDDNDRSDDDDDDEPSRMSFTINTGAVERQKIRETFLSLQDEPSHDLETEEAAELDRWEQEQIRKGVGVTQIGPAQNPSLVESQLYTLPPATLNIPSYVSESSQPNGNVPVPLISDLLKSNSANLTTSDIKARLQERLSALKTQHKAHKQELIDCGKELTESYELVKKLEIEGPVRAQNFSLYQQMSGYVKDLVECLDLKVAHIEILDSKILDLYKNRAQKLTYRRQQDVRDQSDEFSTLSSEILKGVSAEFLSEKPSCTDEIKLRRIAEREGRRMRRRKQRERVMMIVRHQEGMSTDDEEPDIDVVTFKQHREEVLDESKTIFEDVVSDFGTLEGVMFNFEKWKYEQSESYREAYVPLCLPKIFGTFVRLALLDWNPLEEDKDFQKMDWFCQLACYGCRNLNEDKSDPDINLLPGIIEKVVLSKIMNYVQNVWDPLSRKQSSRLVQLIKDLYINYPTINTKSKQLQGCLKAVSARIYKTLDDDIFVPLYPKELLESRSLGAFDFFQRQFWTAFKLLQNILMWDGIIAEQPLQQMALASLLNRYLLMGLYTSMTMKDALEKCKMIVESFPKVWFKCAKGGTTLPLLKQFSSFLLKFADSYYSQNIKKSSEADIKEVIKEIVQLLVTMESLDDAVSVAKKYSVSGFKS